MCTSGAPPATLCSECLSAPGYALPSACFGCMLSPTESEGRLSVGHLRGEEDEQPVATVC